jgi:hypothetical protein
MGNYLAELIEYFSPDAPAVFRHVSSIIMWFERKGKQMKYSSLLAALITLSLAACGQKTAETPAPQAPATAPSATLPAGHPTGMAQTAPELSKTGQTAQLPPLTQKAQVLSVINVTQFTYLEITQDNKTRWLATTTSAAKKGDTIQFDEGTLMSNFNSKILNRTFPSITFVGRVVVSNQAN